MIRFVRCFSHYWREYDAFLEFWMERKEQLAVLISGGEYWYKNRLDYAWKNACDAWKHC